MKILTCNIRDARADDGDNCWEQRKNLCADVLRQQQADILCFQEMRANQRRDLADALPEYSVYGLAEDPAHADTPNAIFFRHDRFRCLEQGGYWLSETPDIPASRSWGSAYIRLANWVCLQAIDEPYTLHLTNTHLEDNNPVAAAQQAHLIVQRTPANTGNTVQILAGDMNTETHGAALAVFRAAGWQDSYAAVHPADPAGRTFHAFQGEQCTEAPAGKIDWILTRGNVHVLAAEIIRDRMELRFPSDHYFVSATLRPMQHYE